MARLRIKLRPGENPHPAGYRIKVVVDETHKAYETTKGGIIIEKDRGLTEAQLKMGAERGVLTEVGPLAGYTPGESPSSWGLDKIGRHLLFERYEGAYYEQEDGTAFIFLNDRDIIAFIDQEETDNAR